MTENQKFDRRVIDKAHLDIRELILKTDSPKDKAMLLILLKISESLEANTSMTHEVSTKLDMHLENYTEHEKIDAIRSAQIKTGWRVISGIIILLQGLGIYAVRSHIEESQRIGTEIVLMRRDVDILKNHSNQVFKVQP